MYRVRTRTTLAKGVPHSYESVSHQDPAPSRCLEPYGGPWEGRFLTSEVPLDRVRTRTNLAIRKDGIPDGPASRGEKDTCVYRCVYLTLLSYVYCTLKGFVSAPHS